VLAALWHCAVFIITHQFVMSSSSWNAGVGASYSGEAAAFTTGSKYFISLCACRGDPLRKRTITTRQPASLSLSLYSRPVCRFLSVSYLVLRRLWLHCVSVRSVVVLTRTTKYYRLHHRLRKCAETLGTVLVPWAILNSEIYLNIFLKLNIYIYIYIYIFFILKYSQAVSSNSTRELLWFEITKMLIAV